MGGKSSDSSSRQMIQMQKEEASSARAKEEARQGRLTSGLERIRQAFEGAPVMGTRGRNFDWASAAGAGGMGKAALPQGYSWQQGPSTPGAPVGTAPSAPRGASSASGGYVGGRDAVQPGGGTSGTYYGSPYSSSSNSGGGYQQTPRTASGATSNPATPGAWMIRGPDGRLYKSGEQIPYYEQYDTGGRTGGIGENFYNDFRNKMVNYYMPQVAEQYKDAKDEATFGHARAGTLRSTAAQDTTSKLYGKNLEREGEVRSKADEATAGLRGRVAGERAKAESQLYATENPDVAANQALAAITNISAEEPSLSPLASLFEPLAIGGASAMKGFQNASLRKAYVPPGQGGYGATSVISSRA